MGGFAVTLALCSLVAGIAGGLALRLLPTLSLRLAGLALLAWVSRWSQWWHPG